MSLFEFFADLVLLAHAIYSMFVLCGWVIMLAGPVLGWRWAGNRGFRWLHLSATLFVISRVWINLPCPFSVAEDGLRQQTTAVCPLGEPAHGILKRLAFRGADPHRFALSTTLFGAWVLIIHIGTHRLYRSRLLRGSGEGQETRDMQSMTEKSTKDPGRV